MTTRKHSSLAHGGRGSSAGTYVRPPDPAMTTTTTHGTRCPHCMREVGHSDPCRYATPDVAVASTARETGALPSTCGCIVGHDKAQHSIVYCPLHAAAGEMRESIRQLVRMIDPRSAVDVALVDTDALAKARALLARLGG